MKTTMRKALLAGAALFAPLLVSQTASAAACAVSDVTLTIAGTLYIPTNCGDGVNQGGGGLAETASLNSVLGHAGFAYLDSSGDASTPAGLGGVTFTVTASAGNSGSWTVSWTDVAGLPNLPLIVDLEVALFGGNNGSGYFFDDVLLPVSPTSGSGTFDINFTNHGGQQPNLSHLLLAGGNAHVPPVNDDPGPTQTPEPISLALLGSGLIGLGLVNRRRKAG